MTAMTGQHDESKHPRAKVGPNGGQWVAAPRDEAVVGADGVDLTGSGAAAPDTAAWEASIPDTDFTGSGWGTHRPDRTVSGTFELRVGDLLAVQSTTHKQRNLARVIDVRPDEWGGPPLVLTEFVDPTDPTKPRTPPAPPLPVDTTWNTYFHTDPTR